MIWRFHLAGPQQMNRIGWSHPLGHSYPAASHIIGSNAFFTARLDERLLPRQVVEAALAEKVADIEVREKRKVGRKQRLENAR